ncbi:MAG: DUF975 family protein [Bacilli bacterium]|nr:DUF975 family protein [Bacilli bacterium]
MKKPRYEYKNQAKQMMSDKYGPVIVILLISYAISVAVSPAAGVVTILAMAGFTYGYTKMFVDVTKGTEPDLQNILFIGFKENYTRNLICYLLRALYTFLWGLLFVIPGIIKTYSYSMAFYLLLKEPELKGEDAITKSREYMNGHKMDLFILHLSYIGWYILSAFTFGILLLWIIPKVQTTTMLYFEEIYLDKNPQKTQLISE